MAKKKGGNKADADQWGDEPEVTDPIAAAQRAAMDDAAADHAAPKAGSKKKNKKPAPTGFAALAADDDDDDDMVGSGESSADASEDEAPKAAPKRGKKSKPAAPPPPPESDGDEVGEVVIKTAKQKEREKKEKARLLKKQKADEAKAKREEELRSLEASLGTATLEDEASAVAAPAAAGKAKKAKKKGGKKGDDEDGDGDAPAVAADEPKKAEAKKDDKKKAKKGAPIAALQKMIEEQRRMEEERQRAEEELRRRFEEEERLAAEEEARQEAEREAKREAERLRREQLKREGKLLTKSEKQAKARREQRLQAVLASGVQVAGLAAGSQDGEQRPRREADPRKRKAAERKRKEEEEEAQRKKEEEMAAAAAAAEAASKAAEESDGGTDDWEGLSSGDDGSGSGSGSDSDSESGKEPAKAKAPGTSWEGEDEEESEEDDDSSSDDSGSDESDSDDSYSDGETAAERQAARRKRDAAARREQRMKDALAARSEDDLRSPICCILGHVDVGKTLLLDKIRQTNVQAGEAGGITQQIGATYFPAEAIVKKTASLSDKGKMNIKVPGLLIIDTPGHESFTNLRSRGSSLCDIAILVVDIMHGLEPQTLESLRLLRDRKASFIVALNKVDRMYGWLPRPNGPFRASLKVQPQATQDEFAMRVARTITEFAEQGLNAELYYNNKKDVRKVVSLVPVSAVTGEGIPDLLGLLVGLTQKHMTNSLMYLSELACTVLEVKAIEGLGMTIDVVLSNGVLHEGDRIVLCGLDGAIVTTVRALLTPQPMRELRIKSAYVHHKSIKAAMGIKICAPDLEKAIAGSRLLVVGPDDDEESLMEEVMSDIATLHKMVKKSPRGVWVQASTLGSLEALLEFLSVSKVPVFDISIGPVHKKDVTRASTMLEKAPDMAVMLCFDVKVEKEAQDLADEVGVKIFKADIIYHLFDAYQAHAASIVEQNKKESAPQAVFPCKLKMVGSDAVFRNRDPLVIGVDVVEGQLHQGTPVCVVRSNPETNERKIISLGKVTSMRVNDKPMKVVRKGDTNSGVSICIECASHETPKTFGRHFDHTDTIYSLLSRASIDVLKKHFLGDVSKDDLRLIILLKSVLGIP
ncbi:eukaryotic translation initiation factor 5B [Coemansia biformis]|uniref:Eukaryotic translation initiation factor 5B n=1 Tax=Coemansia biformis TaxID=1286918 RepID=A0A9W8CWY2_9FUNG|nr:eukaryotic translation initiation factor 5B [Coemansia biformis]